MLVESIDGLSVTDIYISIYPYDIYDIYIYVYMIGVDRCDEHTERCLEAKKEVK